MYVQSIPSLFKIERSCSPQESFPMTPAHETCAPKDDIFIATLAAPPAME